MRMKSGWPIVFVVTILGLIGWTSVGASKGDVQPDPLNGLVSTPISSQPVGYVVVQEQSDRGPRVSQLETHGDSFEPVLELDQPSLSSDQVTTPFHISGGYRSPDIAVDFESAHQGLEESGPEAGLESNEESAGVLVAQDLQEPSSDRSVFRNASGPNALPPVPKRKSEVVIRPRHASQPIAELAIAEWSPLAVWPKPEALVNQLNELEKRVETASWSRHTLQLLKQVHNKKTLHDPHLEEVFQQLADQLYQLNQIAVSVSTVPVQRPEYAQGTLATQLRTLHYDIARRLMVWAYISQRAKGTDPLSPDSESAPSQRFLNASQSRLVVPELDPQWSEYLGLESLERAFNSLNPDPKAKRDAARVTMARLHSSVLSAEQRQYLSQAIHENMIEFLRGHAVDSVKPTELMKILEKHESDTTGYTSHKLNDIYQSLLWSNDPTSQQLASQLEGHYRNANFRVSVSDELINRLLPQTPEIQQPIHENIMGAQVQGNSRINNRLLIRLIPDNRKVNLRLEANGWVRSLTQARRSGFVVENVGVSRFQVFKRLAIHRNGVESDDPYAVSDTDSQVVGMRSNLDPIPIVGWVARQIARNKIEESAPLTDRYTRQKLESTAKEQIETEVQSHLDQVSEYLFANMLQPLIALDLEPTPIEMRTTENRVIMRYRLAGRDHMASHTVRPRALSDSLMSVQFHESTFNNLLDRIEIRGKSFTARELSQHLENVFRSDQATGSDELNHEANFSFAPYDPIRIEFKDEKIEISLNLRKFRVGKGKTWKNLNVRASYFPEVRGSQLRLVRDPSGIRLKGSNLKLRDQVAVRAVFTALFRDHYDWNVLPEKFQQKFNSTRLEISQLAINDGWIGLSLSDAPSTAQRPPVQQIR